MPSYSFTNKSQRRTGTNLYIFLSALFLTNAVVN